MMYETENVFVRRHATYGIMVVSDGGVWDVYYSIPSYPWNFAFGLPKTDDLGFVFQIAESNFDIFSADMFEEE